MGMRRGRNQGDKEPVKLSKDKLRRALHIFQYVLPYKWAFIFGMIFLSAGSLIFLGIMKVPGEIFNVISGESSYGLSLNQLFVVIIGLLALQSLLSYFRVQLFAVVSEKSMALLRKELYQKMISLSITFFEVRRVGELTSRITNDVTQVQGVVSVTLAEFIRQIIILIGGVLLLSLPCLVWP